jgi:DNA polymerase I-like protein with 3'-5' exonuclease and polymerase domains
MNDKINLKNICALLCSDVDIFLLKESDQETDVDKTFTVEEVRSQLENSMLKIMTVLENNGYDIDKTIKR